MESLQSLTVCDQSFRHRYVSLDAKLSEQAHETQSIYAESPASVMQCCKGLRVCSTESNSIGTVLSDHSAEHSAEWSAVTNEHKPCVEMGTVTDYHFMIGVPQDIWLHVQWDCGLTLKERQYSFLNGEWRTLKAIDPAPTGLFELLWWLHAPSLPIYS